MGKTKKKAVSDEAIIAAIMENATFKDAAEKIGVSVRTIQDRMKDDDFRKLYNAAKRDLLRSACKHINDKLEDSINTVAEIMNDREVNAAVRLQAAQTIITNAVKFSERLSKEEFSDTIDYTGFETITTGSEDMFKW